MVNNELALLDQVLKERQDERSVPLRDDDAFELFANRPLPARRSRTTHSASITPRCAISDASRNAWAGSVDSGDLAQRRSALAGGG